MVKSVGEQRDAFSRDEKGAIGRKRVGLGNRLASNPATHDVRNPQCRSLSGRLVDGITMEQLLVALETGGAPSGAFR